MASRNEKKKRNKRGSGICSLISIRADGRVPFVSIYPHGVAWNEGART